eukprot:5090517-Prymnesium_polylepis.1
MRTVDNDGRPSQRMRPAGSMEVVEYGELQQRNASVGAMMPAASGPVQAEADDEHEETEATGPHANVRQPAVVQPSQMHKGYSYAISPPPDESAPLLEGQRVAVYFDAPHDDWFEGVVIESTEVGGSVPLRFVDGEHPVVLPPQEYGRFNKWVAPDMTRREEWSSEGHELLGRLIVHEGADGILRMWSAARREFILSVCDDAATGIEVEVL